MKFARQTLIALLALSAPAAAQAPAANPAAVIEARQANFKAIGRANKGVGDELKKSSPDLATIRTNAAALDAASRRVYGYFPNGTGPEAGVKTEALPVIWQKPAEFAQANTRFLAAVRALKAAADAGDLAQVRTASGNIGPTCKGCHDQFRGKQ